ncbi:MAG: MMPL family transporter [Desulfobacter sp.]|nr:MMPL family transporter [Desulfobacter sp.]
MTQNSEHSSPVLQKVLNQIRELTKDDPDVTCIGGVADIFSGLANHVVQGQLVAIASSIILISLILMIVFRSFIAGVLGAVPLGLSVIFLFGLMGYLGIELNIINALLSSIMIGVGVDYTIHFLWRYKKERKNHHDHVEAIKHTLLTTGRGIIFNALSVVVGFSILFSSHFVPVKFFGFLIIV